jgi:acetylornithine deacetylase
VDLGKASDILETLVRFDTTSRNSNLALIEWIESYLDRLHVPHQRVTDASGAKANIWATIGPAERPGYILSGHTDTVPVDGQTWTNDPFRLTARSGRLYGRGSTDMKGFVACCLAAVPEMAAQTLWRPIHLGLTYDEEVGCFGVQRLIGWLAERKIKPAAAIVGEPTLMNPVIGHKGKRSFRVTVRGRTCHSSQAPLGVNAVEYAARLIAKIREIADRLARSGARDALYDVPFTTAHTGMVHGGSVLNIVPDECVFEYEFRTIAGEDSDALVGEIVRYAHDVLEPEMKAVAPEARIEFAVRSNMPSLDTPPEAEIVGLAKTLSGHNDHGKVAFSTEAGRYAAAGIPSVVIGPGSIDQAHKADEFIAMSELAACGQFLDRLIAYCRD